MRTEEIREIVGKHARLPVDVAGLGATDDLYAAGLTSLTTVHLMLAIEDHFDVEFPDEMLSRQTFESLQSIAEAVAEIQE